MVCSSFISAHTHVPNSPAVSSATWQSGRSLASVPIALVVAFAMTVLVWPLWVNVVVTAATCVMPPVLHLMVLRTRFALPVK